MAELQVRARRVTQGRDKGQAAEGVRLASRRRRPIGYVFARFPAISETFLLREITALAELGLPILPLAMARWDGPVHAEARPWLKRVVVRPDLDPAGISQAAMACALRYPAGWVSAVRMAASLIWRYPSYAREIATSLASAAYFAAATGEALRHVHAAFASYPATCGMLLAEILGVGFSFAAHARDIFTSEASFLQIKLREAEFVVTCSEVGRQHLMQAASATERSRLYMVRHGIDTSRYIRQKQSRRPRPFIMSAGRLVPKKGFVHLLQAAALLMRADVNFELHIFGEGPEEDHLRQLIRALHLEPYVKLEGFVPHEQLAAALGEADLFVLASVQAPDGDNEGVPNVLVEALAMEVPVVATRSGGIPELIQHEVTGLLAEPGNPVDLARNMERLLSDRALREAVATTGRLKVEREYELRHNAASLLEIFRRHVR
ncbi:MAG: glycosyltransferase family 4 protein [Armatimonadetes bacterium]|nr:glycosyltransferase family 4 protein [Armatimonadota bacterium]